MFAYVGVFLVTLNLLLSAEFIRGCRLMQPLSFHSVFSCDLYFVLVWATVEPPIPPKNITKGISIHMAFLLKTEYLIPIFLLKKNHAFSSLKHIVLN